MPEAAGIQRKLSPPLTRSRYSSLGADLRQIPSRQ